MQVGRTSDKQSSTAAVAMASGGAALQLLATQRYGEAGRALQLAAMLRSAERCSSLLWRDRQQVAARYCGNGQWRCNSRRWAGSTATRGNGQQHCNLRRWAGNVATRGDGRQRPAALANAALQRFCFFVKTTSRAKEREIEREREGEPLKPVQRSPLCWLAGM